MRSFFTQKILQTALLFFRDERGATAIEYGLMVAGIGLSLAGAFFLLGDDIRDLFTALSVSADTAATEFATRDDAMVSQ
jgi:Flp pilus assembly pilin Flp